MSERTLYYHLKQDPAFRALLSNLQDVEISRVRQFMIGKTMRLVSFALAIAEGRQQCTPTRWAAIDRFLAYSLGRPAQGSVAIEAHTDQDGNTIRIIVGHPPRE
jgi:hypothetical protein